MTGALAQSSPFRHPVHAQNGRLFGATDGRAIGSRSDGRGRTMRNRARDLDGRAPREKNILLKMHATAQPTKNDPSRIRNVCNNNLVIRHLPADRRPVWQPRRAPRYSSCLRSNSCRAHSSEPHDTQPTNSPIAKAKSTYQMSFINR